MFKGRDGAKSLGSSSRDKFGLRSACHGLDHHDFDQPNGTSLMCPNELPNGRVNRGTLGVGSGRGLSSVSQAVAVPSAYTDTDRYRHIASFIPGEQKEECQLLSGCSELWTHRGPTLPDKTSHTQPTRSSYAAPERGDVPA